MRVRVVRLWKWFIGCSLMLVWFSVFFGFVFVDQYKDSFLYLGGMHGYNVSNWLVSQVGVPGVWLLLLVTDHLLPHLSECTDCHLVAQIVQSQLLEAYGEGGKCAGVKRRKSSRPLGSYKGKGGCFGFWSWVAEEFLKGVTHRGRREAQIASDKSYTAWVE